MLQSSHSLTELEARTDRIAILQQGRLVANASLEVLQMSAALPTELIVTPTPGRLGDLLRRMPAGVIETDRLVLACQPTDKVSTLRKLWALEDLVADIQVKAPRLDDIYRFYCASSNKGQHSGATDNGISQHPRTESSTTEIPAPGTLSGEHP